MVYLNRIYTKTGDAGETSLGDGSRVSKTSLRIKAYGGVDELNAILGGAVATGISNTIAPRLRQIQNDLFDLGADLCVPETVDPSHPPLRMLGSQTESLEAWIDEATAQLTPLNSFVLPGGMISAAALHHARTVCRRVEIGVIELAACEQVNSHVLTYLNRLSDLLFVWARLENGGGKNDVLWVPGQNRQAK